MKALLASLAVLLAAACTQTPAPGSSAPNERDAVGAGGSMALFAELDREAGPAGNVFVSPVSIEQAFGLLHAGTAGSTRQQLESFFGWPQGADVGRQLKRQRQQLLDHDTDADLRLANALWLSDAFRFRPAYLDEARQRYAATARALDFAGDPSGAATQINSWAAEQTAGLIDSVITPDALADDTTAVLTNALYFEAEWALMFDGAEAAPFLFGDGREENFRLMTQTEPFAVAERDGWRAIRLPYRGDRFAMDVIMPRERRVMEMAPSAVELEALGTLLDESRLRPVNLWLPRFEIDFDSKLVDPLERLGLTLPFSRNEADLSAMAEPGQQRLYVGDATHITKLQVYEDGTKAAAVTVLKIVLTGGVAPREKPLEFKVDRPFVTVIRDLQTAQVLFVGRIADPQAFTPQEGEDPYAP